MKKDVKILFLIMARGGSKGLPGKNLEKIQDLSLLGYKAKSALSCPYCSRIVLSSEDPLIIKEAETFGIEIPFIRPTALATDNASSDSVVSHLVDWIDKNENNSYDAIMLLEPSSPFATSKHYEEAIEIFIKEGASLVLGVRKIDTPTIFTSEIKSNGSIPSLVKNIKNIKKLRRQDQPLEVTPNGALYLIKWDEIKKTQKIYSNPDKTYGLIMDNFNSIEIETPEDLAYARFIVSENYFDISPWRERGND